MKIIEVVSVVDTREYVEDRDDRFVPVAGSGVVHDCDRCGKEHEVHATVKLADGSLAVVGTSCAKQESTDIVKALRNGAARAKRRAAESAKWAAKRRKMDAREEAKRLVAMMTRPAVTFTSDDRGRYAHMDDARVWIFAGGFNAERETTLDNAWVDRRVRQILKGTW